MFSTYLQFQIEDCLVLKINSLKNPWTKTHGAIVFCVVDYEMGMQTKCISADYTFFVVEPIHLCLSHRLDAGACIFFSLVSCLF